MEYFIHRFGYWVFLHSLIIRSQESHQPGEEFLPRSISLRLQPPRLPPSQGHGRPSHAFVQLFVTCNFQFISPRAARRRPEWTVLDGCLSVAPAYPACHPPARPPARPLAGPPARPPALPPHSSRGRPSVGWLQSIACRAIMPIAARDLLHVRLSQPSVRPPVRPLVRPFLRSYG